MVGFWNTLFGMRVGEVSDCFVAGSIGTRGLDDAFLMFRWGGSGRFIAGIGMLRRAIEGW